MFVPYDTKVGDPIPGSKWFNDVLRCIRSLRIVAARDSGLVKTEGEFGTTLRVEFPDQLRLGVVTVGFTACSGTTPGFGTVQPYGWNGTSLFNLGTPIKVLNWTGSTTATAGKRVKYGFMYGVAWLNGNDCSGAS